MSSSLTTLGVRNDTEDCFTSAGGWVMFWDKSGFHEKDSWNVSSITDHSTGQASVTWDNDFTNAFYAWTGYSHYGGGTNDTNVVQAEYTNQAVGSIRIVNKSCINDGSPFGVLAFEEGVVVAFGDLT